MYKVKGPDGLYYYTDFIRDKYLEDVLYLCTERKVNVFYGQFPWVIQIESGGYKVHLKDGWKQLKSIAKMGFFVGNGIYLDSRMSPEKKLAIGFHEIVHIIEDHEEGDDIETEIKATELAMNIVNCKRDILKEIGYEVNEIFKTLEDRLELYKTKGV